MEYSRFSHAIHIGDDVFALYNSLLMDILLLTTDEITQLDKYTKDNNTNISKDLLDHAVRFGILVQGEEKDHEALKRVQDLYEAQSGKISVVYFLVTSDCNLACKYCFIENPNCEKVELHNMSKETALVAINKYIEYLKNEHIENALLIFYGGEPTLNWDVVQTIVDIASHVENINFQYTIVTNGTLLDEHKIRYIRQHNINLGVSIDGPKEINDYNRIYKNSIGSVYDTVISNIYSMKENVHICLSITLAPSVVERRNEVLEWLDNSQFKSIGYNLYCYTRTDDNWEKYSIDATDMIIDSYEKLRKKIFDDRIERKIESLREKKFKFTDCGAIGGNQLVIKANGDVCVCHAYEKTDKYTIGNICKDNIEDIIQSQEFRFWRTRVPIYYDECLNCEALFCCGGGCVTRAESLFGNRSEIDRPFCIHTKKLLMWFLKHLID